MVELKPITEDNFLDAFNLKLAPGQEEFGSHPIRSLAQAYVYRTQCQPFGIYAEGEMVGYVMVIYDWDIPEYDIWHMMIDESMQGRGFGGEALDRVLDYIKTKPFGGSDKVTLTCNKENPKALSLYKSRGFRETGSEASNFVVRGVWDLRGSTSRLLPRRISKNLSRPKRNVPFETNVTPTSASTFRCTNVPSAVSGRSRGADASAATAHSASPAKTSARTRIPNDIDLAMPGLFLNYRASHPPSTGMIAPCT